MRSLAITTLLSLAVILFSFACTPLPPSAPPSTPTPTPTPGCVTSLATNGTYFAPFTPTPGPACNVVGAPVTSADPMGSVVIQSAAQWTSFWASWGLSPAPAPPVSFTSQMVLLTTIPVPFRVCYTPTSVVVYQAMACGAGTFINPLGPTPVSSGPTGTHFSQWIIPYSSQPVQFATVLSMAE